MEKCIQDKIITDEKEIADIIDFNKKIRFSGIKIFNTPWAKNKNTGERDLINLAVFVEFSIYDYAGFVHKKYWLISEKELFTILHELSAVASHNREKDQQAIIFKQKNTMEGETNEAKGSD